MHPRPAILLSTARFWRTLLCQELYHASIMLVINSPPDPPNAEIRHSCRALFLVTTAKEANHESTRIQRRIFAVSFDWIFPDDTLSWLRRKWSIAGRTTTIANVCAAVFKPNRRLLPGP